MIQFILHKYSTTHQCGKSEMLGQFSIISNTIRKRLNAAKVIFHKITNVHTQFYCRKGKNKKSNFVLILYCLDIWESSTNISLYSDDKDIHSTIIHHIQRKQWNILQLTFALVDSAHIRIKISIKRYIFRLFASSAAEHKHTVFL